MSLVEVLGESFEGLRARALAPVDVAVVDSGVDATHPDLAGRVVRQFHVDWTEGGTEVLERQVPECSDTFGHGTAVASIIARMAPNARIWDIRVLGGNNSGKGEILVAGFRYAIDQQIRVVNLSLASTAKFASQLAEICEKAYRANILVVAAKRNVPVADNGFPAELSTCVGVDSGNFGTNLKVKFTGGSPIEFMAHGEDIEVAVPGGGHRRQTGTSLATPTVTGLCALLLGAYPALRPFEIKAVLKAWSI
jgi:subtilisin family serine protease